MKIICIGRNYIDHAAELQNPVPKQPLVFMKPPSALLINHKPLFYPEFTKDLHYEGEIVLKICKNGRHVQPEFARTYFNKMAFGIDFTARDVQKRCKEKGHPWEIAKAFDNSAAVSEFVDAPEDTSSILFETKLNGKRVQNGNTADMIFSCEYIVEYVSKYFKLQIGDLIFTGTPAGVGPVQIGDHLEGFIHGKKLMDCRIK